MVRCLYAVGEGTPDLGYQHIHTYVCMYVYIHICVYIYIYI
jgi:hypothetical protein